MFLGYLYVTHTPPTPTYMTIFSNSALWFSKLKFWHSLSLSLGKISTSFALLFHLHRKLVFSFTEKQKQRKRRGMLFRLRHSTRPSSQPSATLFMFPFLFSISYSVLLFFFFLIKWKLVNYSGFAGFIGFFELLSCSGLQVRVLVL